MSVITQKLADLLQTVQRPGDFYGHGKSALPVLRLAVDGVGVLGLPIPSVQAQSLIAQATSAPYGRGTETILDQNVRKCWQIPASAVHTDDIRWQSILTSIVHQAANQLGVEGEVIAELYKMLVYETGGFFSEHRDTEKAPGMFGTLVISLPSEYQGGNLVIRHEGREITVNLASDNLADASWVAFYADCQHELLPIISGYRVALVYNLIRRNGVVPKVPDYRSDIENAAKQLRNWTVTDPDLIKLVYPLSHKYSLAELGFSRLKGQDAAAATVLRSAGKNAGCELRLAIVSIHETGSAEPQWDNWGRGRRYRETTYSDVEYEVIDVMERRQLLTDWRSLNDRGDDLEENRGEIAYKDEELSPPHVLDHSKPDEDELHEATGNEGATFERTYRRAALILWPKAYELKVIRQGGIKATLAAIVRMAAIPNQVEQAESLASLLISDWPRPNEDAHQRWDSYGPNRAPVIEALSLLPSPKYLTHFLLEVVARGAFDSEDTPALVAGLKKIHEQEASTVLSGIAEHRGSMVLDAVAHLLREVSPILRPAVIAPALRALIGHLPQAKVAHDWNGTLYQEMSSALAEMLGTARAIQDPKLGEQIVEKILSDPKHWPIDAVVLPAALSLRKISVPGLDLLKKACLDHLKKRISLPLEPPRDASRSVHGLTCSQSECKSLREFLLDPKEVQWRLRAVADVRGHVESHIKFGNLDLDFTTEKKGSPHTLVCTKNQHSYDVRVKQRSKDLSNLAALNESVAVK